MQNLEVFPTTGLHLGGDFTTNLFTRGMSKNISSSDWSNLNSLSCQLLKEFQTHLTVVFEAKDENTGFPVFY